MHTGTLKREAGDAKGEVWYAADALKRPDCRWHDVCETAGMTPDLCPAHGVLDCPCGEAHLLMFGPDSEPPETDPESEDWPFMYDDYDPSEGE